MLKSFSFAVIVLVGTSTFPSISASHSTSSPTSPAPKPSSSCTTGNTPNWQDSYGDGCDWYEAYDTPGCPQYGQDYDGGMGVANDNCCYCEGTGAPIPSTTWPTYSPTVSKAPVTPPCAGSTPGWVDSAGDGCEWYESVDKPGCPSTGNSYEGDMGVANDNCCYCFGTGAPSYPPPTYPPTVSRAPSTPFPTPTWTWPTYSPTVSKAPVTPPCAGSTPGWIDSAGDGCEWYESVDTPGCPLYGNSYEGDMGVANDNCCYCTSTAAPSSDALAPPTEAPSPSV